MRLYVEFLRMTVHRADMASFSSSTLDDAQNYQSTQYLVFPVNDKQTMPQLVNFPADVLGNEKSFLGGWSPDTSLEYTVEIAKELQGDIRINYESEDEDRGIEMHAPYMSPL